MKLNIIIPVYNEEKNIEETLNRLITHLNLKYTIIIVDDYSTDNTLHIIERFVNVYSNIKVITNKSHQGFASALKQGIAIVGHGETFLPLMADGCDEIEIIEDMYGKICEGADIVCASRYIKGGRRIGGSLFKALGSRFVNWIICSVKRLSCHDLTNSFKMFRKEVVESLNIESYSFEIFMELTLKAYVKGYRIVEIPTIWKSRRQGKTHFNLYKDGQRYIKWILYGLKNIKYGF